MKKPQQQESDAISVELGAQIDDAKRIATRQVGGEITIGVGLGGLFILLNSLVRRPGQPTLKFDFAIGLDPVGSLGVIAGLVGLTLSIALMRVLWTVGNGSLTLGGAVVTHRALLASQAFFAAGSVALAIAVSLSGWRDSIVTVIICWALSGISLAMSAVGALNDPIANLSKAAALPVSRRLLQRAIESATELQVLGARVQGGGLSFLRAATTGAYFPATAVIVMATPVPRHDAWTWAVGLLTIYTVATLIVGVALLNERDRLIDAFTRVDGKRRTHSMVAIALSVFLVPISVLSYLENQSLIAALVPVVLFVVSWGVVFQCGRAVTTHRTKPELPTLTSWLRNSVAYALANRAASLKVQVAEQENAQRRVEALTVR